MRSEGVVVVLLFTTYYHSGGDFITLYGSCSWVGSRRHGHHDSDSSFWFMLMDLVMLVVSMRGVVLGLFTLVHLWGGFHERSVVMVASIFLVQWYSLVIHHDRRSQHLYRSEVGPVSWVGVLVSSLGSFL